MMLTPDQPRREFSSKLRPENCKEVDMLNYLFDCYERVAYEERTAPKVCMNIHLNGIIKNSQRVNVCLGSSRSWAPLHSQ